MARKGPAEDRHGEGPENQWQTFTDASSRGARCCQPKHVRNHLFTNATAASPRFAWRCTGIFFIWGFAGFRGRPWDTEGKVDAPQNAVTTTTWCQLLLVDGLGSPHAAAPGSHFDRSPSWYRGIISWHSRSTLRGENAKGDRKRRAGKGKEEKGNARKERMFSKEPVILASKTLPRYLVTHVERPWFSRENRAMRLYFCDLVFFGRV